METKKNPKKDLTRSSGLYFLVGLVLVLLLTYVALEWNTYDKPDEYAFDLNKPDNQIDEEAPIFKLEIPPPPQPPVAPDVIEIVPDDPEIIETVIATSEALPDQVIAVGSIVYDEIDETPEVPFSVIEKVPVFPGCENEADQRACFQEMILKHIRKTFKYPEIAQEMNIQGKVYMKFVIQKDGNIGEIQILRSPDKNLGEEATRIISKLPKMKPGKQRGTAVKVPFSIPITFKLQ